MQFVTPALNSEDPYHRKAALIALAVLAEGCADYIRNRLVFCCRVILFTCHSSVL